MPIVDAEMYSWLMRFILVCWTIGVAGAALIGKAALLTDTIVLASLLWPFAVAHYFEWHYVAVL